VTGTGVFSRIASFGITACALALLCAPLRSTAATLAIDQVALHQFDDGPVLPTSHEFLPGETVFFSCLLTGYQVDKKDDVGRVKLGWQLRVADSAGVLLEKETTGRIEDQVLPQDKNWKPKFGHTFVVPPYAGGGVYHVTVKVKDELSGAEVNAPLEFHVRGVEVAPSAELAVRNFRFLRSEDDNVSVQTFHPGETLWARFDITGYKFMENNRFSVEYGLAVLRADGEQVFAQPVAAMESNESFYPQRFVPGVLSLSLDKAVPAGAYTLLVTVTDKTGNQTAEHRGAFQIE
jgi:hypothetical protein